MFFFNPPATPEISTLSLHDALPICQRRELYDSQKHFLDFTWSPDGAVLLVQVDDGDEWLYFQPDRAGPVGRRSEEHTSELQSHSDLVCRLLLEKKKK